METREERLERKRREKAEQMQYKLEQEIALWDPHNSESATGDPYKTLFVSRINYDTSESKLRREFEIYGPIKKIVMVHNIKTGKPRGYAFIEYEHERDMHSAYKHADGKKIDNRRVLVDVERARTVKGWLSRRLGGGLGGTRRGGPDVNIKHSGREDDRRRGGSARDEDRMASNDRERVDRDRDRERERRHTRSREREREPRERRRRSRSVTPVERTPSLRSPDAAEVLRSGRDPSATEKFRTSGVASSMRSRKTRDRKRRRSRSRERGATVPEEGDDREKRRHRSRSRDRKRRSKSRERKHRRERDRERRERVPGEEGEENIKIKQEPEDDYPDYEGSYYNNFPMKDEDERAKNGTKYEEEEEEANNEIDY